MVVPLQVRDVVLLKDLALSSRCHLEVKEQCRDNKALALVFELKFSARVPRALINSLQ